MPDYQDIYNHIFSTETRYTLAENSPGLRILIQASDRLQMLSGRALDVGCGVGFVVEHLAKSEFKLKPYGVDVSDKAIAQACGRLQDVPGIQDRLLVLKDKKLPFDDNSFSLVTCFDVLEHLDEVDIETMLREFDRVLNPRGVFLGSVSCRSAGVVDKNGDNLHRCVKSPDWWIDKVLPQRAEYDGTRVQLVLWKRVPIFDDDSRLNSNEKQASDNLEGLSTSDESMVGNTEVSGGEDDSHNTASLYQEIYDDNPWYGDADQGRCPGVRLLPHYQDWLVEPVMDLGCGRGQTVEHLRSIGIKADGIDQINKHPEMRVGDITKRIDDLDNFNSVVCVDCIEHLKEEQVLGLFENMKRVKRQAFSIHNGPSIGTGQELHVNRQSFQDWAILIRKHFDIAAAIEIHPEQMLYLTQSKSGPT